MPITVAHALSVTIADVTTPGIVKPSNWNSSHNVSLSLASNELIKSIVAGTQSISSGNLSVANSNGVSFGLSNGILTASHNALAVTDAELGYLPRMGLDPNGFPNGAAVTSLSWDDSTRTLTIAPLYGAYDVWTFGQRFIKTGPESVVMSNVEGLHFFYHDATGALVETQTFDPSFFVTASVIAGVYWDYLSSKAAPYCIDGRADATWPVMIRAELGSVQGCVYQDGLALTVDSTGAGDSENDIRVAADAGNIWNVDLLTVVAARLATANIAKVYRYGATGAWRVTSASSGVMTTAGTGRAAYNRYNAGTWSLEEIPDGEYGVAHIFAGPGVGDQWFVIVDDDHYVDVTTASVAACTVPELGIIPGGINPALTFQLVGSVIFRTDNTFTNSTKSRIENIDGGASWFDWRGATGGSGGGGTGGVGIQLLVGTSNYSSGGVSLGAANGFTFINTNGSIGGSHNGLTTARASNDAIGLNSALTANGVSMTANSSGLSLNVPAFLTTAAQSGHSHGNPTLNLTNLSGTTASASNGFTLSLSAVNALTTAAQSGHSHGNPTLNLTNVSGTTASGSNGFTLSLSAVNALTTAAQSGHSHGNPTLNLTNVSGTTASGSNGFTLSLSANAPGAGAFAAGVSTGGNTDGSTGITGTQLVLVGAGQVSLSQSTGANGGTVSLSIPFVPQSSAYVAAVEAWSLAGTKTNCFALADHQHFGVANISAGTRTGAGGVVFSNSNGISFGMNAGLPYVLTASHDGLTTAAQSGHSHGNPTLALTNLGGTTASASNGFTLSLSMAAGAGDGYNILAAGGSTAAQTATIGFGNANGISFSLNGSTITASHDGLTTAAQSGHSHGNPTLNLTNVSGTTASGSNGFTLSLSANAPGAGATFGKYTQWPWGQSSGSNNTNSSMSINQWFIPNAISFTRVDVPVTIVLGSSAAPNTANLNISSALVLYSRNGSTLSPMVGASGTITLTWASNTSNFANISGGRLLSFPIATTLPAGEYFAGLYVRTTNNSSIGTATTLLANTFGIIFGMLVASGVDAFTNFGAVTGTSLNAMSDGVWTTYVTNTTQTVALSNVSVTGTAALRANFPLFFNG